MRRFFKALGKFIWNLIKLLIILVLLAALVAGIWFYHEYARPILALKAKAEKIAKDSTVEDFRSALTTIVYDANGEKISTLRSEKASYYLTYKELPQWAVDVMLVTEDKKFYSHEGVDFAANVRAFYYLVKNKGEITQGGSTITQQLARTVYLTNEVSYERKMVEVFLAWELEDLYSKNEIMEFYLNNIYFGNGYYGIQAAAYGYFGRSVMDLSLSETVFICAIPNNPSLYDPLVRMEKTLERRDRMLRQMLEDGKITQKEHDDAVAEEIILGKSSVSRNNYVETYVNYCAVRALMEEDGFTFRTSFSGNADREQYEERYDASYSYWQQKLYTGGYRIYTSIDLEKQAMLQEAVNEGTAGFTEVNEEGIYKLQASAVCIDNETGYVVAIVGGREQEYAGYTLNRAYQSFRQPGSAIKPLIIYTPWFERGLTPDSMVLDAKFEGGPKNSGSYLGEITVRAAVEYSKNTVAWKLFSELTAETGLSYLKDMKFRRIVDTDYVPAAALGGFTYGVSALEMAGAYAALENDGVFRSPTCIMRITDIDGRDVVGDTITEKRIYEQNAARTMTDVLKGVMTVGTARKNNLETALAAGKTGTADDRKDGWFIGYTSYYTTSVWVGCDMPEEIEDLAGSSYPLSIWKTYMDRIHEGLPVVEFEPYTKVEGTYRAPDITRIPPELLTPTPTPTPVPEEETEGTSAEEYRVTPPPETFGGEEYDPTEDPVW
ncbi:MAG: transglycosylase domain-containing protein [Lachnospiraceae bacterium]|nr:transglycosylase domain-containing protein [Lachnospiraceae bacterium]